MVVTKSKLQACLKANYGMVVGEATLASFYEQVRHPTSPKVTLHGRSLKTGRRIKRAIPVAQLA